MNMFRRAYININLVCIRIGCALPVCRFLHDQTHQPASLDSFAFSQQKMRHKAAPSRPNGARMYAGHQNSNINKKKFEFELFFSLKKNFANAMAVSIVQKWPIFARVHRMQDKQITRLTDLNGHLNEPSENL